MQIKIINKKTNILSRCRKMALHSSEINIEIQTTQTNKYTIVIKISRI